MKIPDRYLFPVIKPYKKKDPMGIMSIKDIEVLADPGIKRLPLPRVLRDYTLQGTQPYSYEEVLDNMLSSGWHIDEIWEHDQTELGRNITLLDIEKVKILIRKGAEVNLHIPPAFSIFRDSGYRVVGGDDGFGDYFPEKKIEILEILKAAGADLGRTHPWCRETLLHEAARYGELRVARWLVFTAGLDKGQKNSLGYTPYDLWLEESCGGLDGEFLNPNYEGDYDPREFSLSGLISSR